MSKHPPDQADPPRPTPRAARGGANPPARVVIAGLGLVTPLGLGAWATYRALLAGKTIADRAPALPDGLLPADIAVALGGVSVARQSAADPAVELAERATREAAAMADLPTTGLPLYLGTSKGAAANLSRQLGMGRPLDKQTRHAAAVGPHAHLAQQLNTRLGTTPRSHHVAACASGLAALDSARRALAYAPNDTDQHYALAVSADAALTPAFVHSYLRLGVLAEPTQTGYRQRPLDKQRRGFMLCETGAAVLLRRLPPGEAPRPGEVELVHTHVACEADHLIRSSPGMPALAYVAGQLRAANDGRPVDALHPHAPGTPDHDPRELQVLLETLSGAGPGTRPPGVYACKGALGHALGAAGLTALVLAALCCRTKKLPPMPWLENPILPCLQPTPSDLPPCATHAVFAAGFGGHTAAALLRAPA